MKTFAIAFLITAAVLLGGNLLYQRHAQLVEYNYRYQTEMRPRIGAVIYKLGTLPGTDMTKARELCLKSSMTPSDADACVTELEAQISEGDDNGCYVQAWVWCDFEGTELDKEAS